MTAELTSARFTHCEPSGLSPPGPNTVHLWRIDLSGSLKLSDCLQILGAEERQRYRRFRSTRDAGRFALRRAALRRILGSYLGISPESLAFATCNTAGKPCLAAPLQDRLRFNTSSSGDVTLIAVGREGEIGVDVEALRPIADFMQIAKRFFTAGERARLEALPSPQRTKGFYRLWVSKEALLKAVGTGLSGGLERFEVSVDPERPPELLRDAEGTPSLFLYPSDPGSGYFGALALDRPHARIAAYALANACGR